jgi:hypothetical protein
VERIVLWGGNSVSRACHQLKRDERRERIGIVDSVEVEAIVAIVEGVLTIHMSVLLIFKEIWVPTEVIMTPS